MRRILVAGFVVVALAVPAGAAAWTPEDCAGWYETHGSNHPDCQDYVPPEVTPPVETPPVVVEQPPVVTPPDVPPTVEDVPPVVTPVDTPDVIPTPTPKVGHRAPNRVEGKEQQNGGGKVTAPTAAGAGTTLPFSGLSVGWVALLGVALLGLGAACRRRIA